MLNDIINLIRVRQWYKNLLVFLPLVFAEKIFNLNDVALTVTGFIALCLVYAALYIFNDLKDLESDKKHPEKKNRPIASGRIQPGTAMIMALVCTALGLAIAFIASFNFLTTLLAIIVLNALYTLAFKKWLFIDLIVIALLLVLRGVSGAVLLNVLVSPWLLLCTFLLALFLAVSKRRIDLQHYTRNYRKGETYSLQELDLLLAISMAALLVSYSIYSFFTHANSPVFWLSVPVAFFIGFRFLHLNMFNQHAALNAEEIFYERQILIAMTLWAIIVVAGIYLK